MIEVEQVQEAALVEMLMSEVGRKKGGGTYGR